MKAIAIIFASAGALFLSSCACTKGGSCCSSGSTMSCCKDSAAKGKTCEKCAAGTKDAKKKM